MSSSIVAKKDMGERGTFQRVEPRVTENNSLGAYSLRMEEGFKECSLFLGVGVGEHS